MRRWPGASRTRCGPWRGSFRSIPRHRGSDRDFAVVQRPVAPHLGGGRGRLRRLTRPASCWRRILVSFCASGAVAAVAELAFRDGIMDRIRLREQRFDERAYLFVLGALEYCQQRLPERRHITGRELALACRDLALDRFGVMARMVLEHWGVRSTSDLGDVVFTLVELDLLMSQASDTRDEFVDVFDFDQAFERDYPWCAQFV